MVDARYPIGQFLFQGTSTVAERKGWIEDLARAPEELRLAVRGLTDDQLNTSYREGGWTVRQVVHHVADSHMNSYIRFRWALTEARPVIKAYDETLWAILPDAKLAPVDLSLKLIESLHQRWRVLLEAMTEADYQKVFIHPQSGSEVSLERNLALYAWHGKHHIAQITALRERMGWL
jgi:uncharacterized damage-inducible protein DinB